MYIKKAGIILGIALGLFGGIGAYTFYYAKGTSYLTDKPGACANCHIMQGHFDSWSKSSHHNVAVCNDCHAPKSFLGKYKTKAKNGYHHSAAFTTGRFHEPIQITDKNKKITEDACRRCHGNVVAMMDIKAEKENVTSCIRCHSTVGHL